MSKLDRRCDNYDKTLILRSEKIFLEKEEPISAISYNSLMNEESFSLVSGYYSLFNRNEFNHLYKQNLIHNPKRGDDSLRMMQGMTEEMVAFAKASGLPAFKFLEKIITKKVQDTIFYEWIDKLRPEFTDESGKKGKQNWWESKRNFDSLIPKEYRWTKAPRLSVKGVTLNGTKKPLKRACLMTICQANKDFVIIDLDMRSAHGFVAAKLAGEDSVIQSLVKNTNLWKEKIAEIRGDFPSDITDKQLKMALKIGVYGTLNGGNPIGDQILDDNIMEGVFSKLKDKQLTKEKLIKIFSEWKLIESIKQLNEEVSTKYGELNTLYGIDRMKEYSLKEKHKLISRYLQGYEVVLLSIISYYILYSGGLVLSLEHDGVVCLFEKKKTSNITATEVMFEVKENITAQLKPWAKFFLKQEIPLDVKLLITHKNIEEF